MKRLLLIIWISIVPLTTFSQVTTVPSNPTDNEEITILFDATGTSLDGYIGDVYAFTGVTVNGGQFSNVLGDWGDNVLNPQLTRDTINLNLYTLLITPTIFDYYGVSTSDNITELVFVFRSADASLQTRPDIFVPIIATNPPPPPPVLSNWGIVGTATPNGWDGPDMPLTYDAISNKWSAVVSLTNGEIKFRDNNIWDFNYGDNEPDGILDRNGANIAIAEGQYLVACDFSALTYAIKPLVSIPDPNFEQALIDLGIDSDGIVNGTILKENVVNIDSLSIGSPLDHSKPFANPLLVNVIAKIGDLTGIESFTNLKYLSAGFNNINSINLSQNTLLEELWINDNDCSFINVSNNPNLKKIGAYVNNLTALDLSNNPLLTHLYLAYNPQLKYLDVRNGNNSNISAFWVYETPNLACINADTINSLVMIDSGKVFDENCGDYAYIPDANFEQALIDLGFDSDGVLNSLILKSDAASIIHLNVNEKNISSLSGIEHFTNLQYLYCNNNLLTTLNLGDKPNLINLDCGRNALTSIDVSNYPKLINLDIWNNQLLSLDVSQNLQLEALIIFTNKLTSLDISVNSKLKFMNFANNKLVNLNIANGNNINFLRPEWATYSFDARNNPALMCIQVDANIINNIPADWFKDEPASYNENCPTINCKELVAIPDANFEQALVDLGYDTNGLTGNIKKCEAASIIDLNVNDKNISSLAGIEHFVGLRYLFCNNNSLSVLDLSSNSNLRGVWANQNFLTAINISNCPNLASLHIWANQLTSLDLSHNPDLEELICSTNKLTTLDVSANSKLKLMNFADNKLVNLNIANGNNINVSGPEWADYSFSATNNPGLSCIQVDENIIGNIPSDWFKDETASYNTNCPIINCEELVAIPDANFEQALIDLGIDTNGLTGDILKCEALSITHLNVNEKNINNLQGIQAFTNLSTLYCQNNQIQVLDISNNTALTILECGGNQLTELNVTQNLLLRVLGFGLNNISEIDVSQNLALEVFWCNNNNITSQNLDLNSTLLVIGLSNNPLTFVSLKNGNNVNVAYFEAYNTPNLACINSDAVVSASMSISGKTFSENCSTTSLAGSWIIAPETRAIKVGPTPGSDLWWYLNKFGDDIASRACYLDDVYVFNENGSFNNVLGSETYLETWQGVAIEGCGAPVTPHDGSTNATYVYDQAGTITLNGQGAYLGLPKVANGYILPNGPVPNSITYDVSFSENGNVMTLGINSGGAFWTYKLIKESVFIPDANFEQALIDLGFDTDGVVNSLISKSDAASIIDLDINNKNISSLAGIEHFVGLRYLFCNNNSLSVLDLSSNSNLRGVWANQNFLTAINISNCPNLETLHLWSNQLTSLIVDNNVALKELILLGNNLTNLDISNNPNLTFLQCNYNQLTSLNIANGNNANFSPPNWTAIAMNASNNPNLNCIQVDSGIINNVPADWAKDETAAYSEENCESLPILYVNDNNQSGDLYTTAIGNNANPGTAALPFATIQHAINKVAVGGVIYVDAGIYMEDVIVNKAVTLNGVQAGVNPVSSLTRGAETVVMSATADPINRSVFILQSSDITIDGFTIDGDNPTITGSVLLNGSDINAGFGIAKFTEPTAHNNLNIRNNIIKNFYRYGVFIQSTSELPLNGNLIAQNHFNNISAQNVDGNYGRWGRGVALLNNSYASVSHNIFTKVSTAILISNFNETSIDNYSITGNIMETYRSGIEFSRFSAGANRYEVNNNHISTGDLLSWTVPEASTTNNNIGINASSISNTTGQSFHNNTIINTRTGVLLSYNISSIPGWAINVHNNSITEIIDYAIINYEGNKVNATCNWYGSTAVQDNLAKITAQTGYFVPFLTNGTDTDPSTNGFQPVLNSCNGWPLSASVTSKTDVTCFEANNGSINISIDNLFTGKAPYTYLWTKDDEPEFSSLDEDPSNLSPGTYRVTITDDLGTNILVDYEGNIINIEVDINEPEVLTATANVINNICFAGNTGSIIVTAIGGTAPYSYLWSNGGTEDQIGNLTAGIYSVLITDANGCTSNTQYEVTQPTQIALQLTDLSTACSNIATVSALGGTGGYAYLWSNGATSAEINAVAAGTYNVIVTDTNGCTMSGSITLAVKEAFNPSASVTNVSCFGGADGSIIIGNVNGQAPFSYSIDGINFIQDQNQFSNLKAGTYTVGVRDANGCTGFVTKTISEPVPILIIIDNVQGTCAGVSAGSISISTSGGSPGFIYSWNGPNGFVSSSKNISSLAPGTYSITVSDTKNCSTTTSSIVVPTTPEIVVNETVVHIACKGETNGSINLAVSGGSGNGFYYSWSVVGATGNSVGNLTVGNYNVTITDIGTGCVVTKNYTITQPSTNVSISAKGANATGCNSMGKITITAAGGTGTAYSYKLDGGEFGSANVFDNLQAGIYVAWAKDSNGCTNFQAVTITDNGSDVYEGNNSKNRARSINVGPTINARIGSSTDVDWFSFDVPTGGGNYILNLNHQSINYEFNLYPSSNLPALTPINQASTTKEYNLSAGKYYIQVFGGKSFSCYNLSVNPANGSAKNDSSQTENEIYSEVDKQDELAFTELNAIAYPNPSSLYFTLKIQGMSLENVVNVSVYDLLGRLVFTKSGSINDEYRFGEEFLVGVYLVKVQQGTEMVSLKVIKK